MQYKDFIDNYTEEFQILDLLDWLNKSKDFWEIPDYLEVDSNNEKTDEEFHQRDQDLSFSSQDNWLLWFDLGYHYTFQVYLASNNLNHIYVFFFSCIHCNYVYVQFAVKPVIFYQYLFLLQLKAFIF